MRLGGVLPVVLALVLSLTTAGAAQTTDLASALAELPACATECFITQIAESTCSASNLTCVCSDKAFYEGAQTCVLGKCTRREGLASAKIEADICDRPKRSRQHDMLLALVIEVPAWFCPWARLYSRWTTTNKLAVDDWLMMVCGVLYTVFFIMGQWAGMYAFGLDTWNVDPDKLTFGLKMFYICESFYLVSLCLTKISVLAFYLRIFPQTQFRYAIWAAMTFVVVPTIVFTFMQIFQCNPISYVWLGWLETDQAHRCVNVNLLVYTAAAFAIAQDLVILVLPLPLLFRLNMGRREKAGIIFMFSLGVFVLITSCVRLSYVIVFNHTANPSWDFVDALIWSGLEVGVSIIVACLPAIRVLLSRVIPGLVSSIVSGRDRSTRTGYIRNVSDRSDLSGLGQSSGSKRRRSNLYFSKNEEENESEIELGIHLGDKMQGEVQTEICGPDPDFELRGSRGIKIQTTTTTRVEEHEPHAL